MVSKSTFFVSIALVALVGYIAGTRSDQLYAAIAPVFGIKASADSLNTSVLQDAYRNLKANYDGKLDADALSDGAVRGMVAAADDRYTVFMDKKEAEEFNRGLSGQVSGIGSEIGRRSNQPTVLRVLNDSPAEKAGVKSGDVFIAVNGESVEGKDASAVASRVRGEAGTSVKLTMKRGESTVDFTIVRAQVSDPSVRWSVSDGVGTMIISRFDAQTASLARQAASELKSQGVKAVIVDLRDNGGGYLNAARDVAGIWLNNQIVVTEKAGDKVTDEVKTGSSAILDGMKTILLVNRDSASASEILAGALQEHGKATLVGQKTFGKGTVQKVLNLADGRLLKVTVARWYTPKGKNITKEGVTPETIVELTADDMNAGRDPQRDKAMDLAK
ncbi:S41 family peptidase [Candidatus Saccharibacteria bacterium oral taxon 955]|nr:S41 family peptidase [Candidatus Saccharibacteria bacterium oral taxon 955]